MTLASQLPLLLAAVFLVGTPHGALDGRLARPLLAARVGHWWLPLFVAGYLAVAAMVVAAWMMAPAFALLAFLALAAVHFGSHDAPSGRAVAIAARGALPIVVPAAAHPQALVTLFSWVAGDGGAALVSLLGGWGLLAWSVAAIATLALEPQWRSRAELVGLAGAVAILPPLVAFSLYFALVHTPRALRTSKRADESWAQLLAAAAPFSLAAITLAAAGYALLRHQLPPEPALVRTTFWWLGALTVPHFLLGLISSQALRPSRPLAATVPPPRPCRRATAPLVR